VATLGKGWVVLIRRKIVLGTLVGAVLLLAMGCASSSSQEQKAYAPHIDPADFTTKVDNKYSPLKPGTTFFYQGNKQGSTRDEMAVTHSTKKIMGVECVVVNDKGWENGKLIEGTFDYYAQDKKGNVWYFGEDTKEYKNGKVTSTKGSWEAGVDGAKPGIIMQAHPKVGQSYRQEYYKGEAEDMAKVLSLNESVTVPYGSFDRVLKTKEWTPLEPSYVEHKYYAPGVGQVYGGGLELVDVKHR
jgi:hypothetical protein